MEPTLGTALSLVGVAIVVLLVVLSAIAGLIYFLTGVIKDKEEDEFGEAAAADPAQSAAAQMALDLDARKKVALIAVALARSTLVKTSEGRSEIGSWRQFYLARRLNQSLRMRRSS